MSKFDPPKLQALTPGELVQAISRFGADAAGVAKAVELIQIQEQLKLQDESDLSAWVQRMLADESGEAKAALRQAGFDENGVYLGADLAPADISEPLPETETRVDNRRVVLETGLEGQFAGQTSNFALTRHGKPLTSPAAALETATADIVTFFQPKSRFVDEVPVLVAAIGFASIFGLALSGNTDPIGLIGGFIFGAIAALLLSRLGNGFPGIFALTSFGVVGARSIRGFLAAASTLALVTLTPSLFSPSKWIQFDAIPDAAAWGGVIVLGSVIGLASSGKSLAPLRVVLTVLLLAALALVAAFSSSGFAFTSEGFIWTNFASGALISLLLNSTLAFSTTVGGIRFHALSVSLSAVFFSVFLLLSYPGQGHVTAIFSFVIVGITLASSFASASTSAGRFWSGLGGSALGVVAIFGLLQLLPGATFPLALGLGLVGAWLAVIAFDSVARKGRLHLASLNRSYGFYGPVSWLALMVWVFSGALGSSLAFFSPLANVLPGVLGAPLISILLALLFSLVRIPEIRSQEEEILIAISRVSVGNQVGIE